MMRKLTLISILLTFSHYSQDPSVDAGPDISACEDESILITGASISDSINSFEWSIVQGYGTITNSSSLEPIYSPSPIDISNGQIVLQLTGSTADEQVTDQMIIYLIQKPTVNLGTEQAQINEGESYVISDTIVSGANEIVWSSSGSGAFSSPNSVNPTYIPSESDIASGNVILTLTVFSMEPCSYVMEETMMLIINPLPSVNVGPDFDFCSEDSITISQATASNFESLNWTTTGNGNFDNPNNINPTYFFDSSDITNGSVSFTLTATGSGQTVSDTMTINFSRPQVQLSSMGGSSNQVVCDGESISDIVFEIENGEDLNLSWDVQPAGIYWSYDPITSHVILSGVPASVNQDTVYNYTLVAIDTENGCESEPISGSITVLSSHNLNLLSSSASIQQVICEVQPMEEIIFELAGGASSAEVIGLPTGLAWNIDVSQSRLTISGTPVVDVSEVTEYQYQVISLGNDCQSIELVGVLTIEPEAEISLESPIATANQFICEGLQIEDITYTFGGGAIDVIYNGLPVGLTSEITYDPVDPNKVSKLTISGTPNVNVTEDTSFEYSIKALNNNGCFQPELNGMITIKESSGCIDTAKILLNGNTSAENNQIKNVADPTEPQDVATKAYADALVSNLGLMNFNGWNNFEVWNDDTTLNLISNSFVFLNADNTTLVLPDEAENGDVIYIYVMRTANSVRPTTLKTNNFTIRDRNENQASSGQSITGIFQGGGGLQIIIRIGDCWMAGGFQKVN